MVLFGQSLGKLFSLGDNLYFHVYQADGQSSWSCSCWVRAEVLLSLVLPHRTQRECLPFISKQTRPRFTPKVIISVLQMRTSLRKPQNRTGLPSCILDQILHSSINHHVQSGNWGGTELRFAVTWPQRHSNFLQQEISSFQFVEPKTFFSEGHKHDCVIVAWPLPTCFILGPWE